MIGRTNAGGGGGGKKSLVLPTNPDLSIKSDDSKLTLSWTTPESEVEIDHYNIYTSLSEPSSLKDMEKVDISYPPSKNIFNPTIYADNGFDNPSNVGLKIYERNGITFTRNDDGSISVKGTATSTSVCYFKVKDTFSGTYTLSGCPSGGSEDTYFLELSYQNDRYFDFGDGVQISDTSISYGRIWICKDTTIDKTFYPQLEEGSTKTDYIPFGDNTYTLTNLTNDQTYYIGIQAVSVEGYENASMWKVENGVPSAIIWVAVGNGACNYSTDGLTWLKYTSLNGTNNGIAYGNESFIALKYTSNDGYTYFCKMNGSGWDINGGVSGILNDICYGNDRFIAVGNSGKSYYSLDGITWVAMSGLQSSRYYYGVVYGNGRFVTVGNGGASCYSTNGTSWVSMSGLETGTGYKGVCYGNGRFVTVGNSGYSAYLLDGSTSWVAMSNMPSSYSFYGVTYGNNIFVTVGDNYSLISTNGTSWKSMYSISKCNSISYAKGKFITVGNNGVSYYSKDGMNWIAMSGLDTSVQYNSVCSNATE